MSITGNFPPCNYAFYDDKAVKSVSSCAIEDSTELLEFECIHESALLEPMFSTPLDFMTDPGTALPLLTTDESNL